MNYLILFSTFIICIQDSLMYSNITTISSMSPTLHIVVIIYTTITSLYYYLNINHIFKKLNIYNDKFKISFIITTLLMIFGSLFYYKEGINCLSNYLHLIPSMLSTIALYIYLLYVIYYLYKYDLNKYNKLINKFKYLSTMLIIFIVVFTRINSYIELFYIFIINYEIDQLKNIN